MLDGVPMAADTEAPARLQILRAFMQFAPQEIWGHISLRPFVTEWVCRLACTKGPGAMNPALRGVAMSILGYFVKVILKGPPDSGDAVSVSASTDAELMVEEVA